jgi:hypothetical protein
MPKPTGYTIEQMEKKYERWLKREEAKPTGKEIEQLKKLERTALSLWKQVVKLQAGGKCAVPGCKNKKRLNCHHIESYSTNKALRYDPMNGMLLCSTHHKFGRLAAHKSFMFMYTLMMGEYNARLNYLFGYYMVKKDITLDSLKVTISDLEALLTTLKKPKLTRRSHAPKAD